MTAMFDTLAFTKSLETAGFDRKQSEALATAIKEVAMPNVATKDDVKDAIHALTVRGISGLVVAVGFLAALITLF